jgi:hypothetical protein
VVVEIMDLAVKPFLSQIIPIFSSGGMLRSLVDENIVHITTCLAMKHILLTDILSATDFPKYERPAKHFSRL